MFSHLYNPQVIYIISDSQNSSDFFVQVILAIFTGTAVVVALFQEIIKNYLNRANLNMRIKLLPPDCHQIDLRNSITGDYVRKAIYIRIRVTHDSGQIAKNTEIIISKVLKLNSNNKWITVKSFLPMNLRWSHTHTKVETIPPKSFKHCDLGSFQQKDGIVTKFIIDTIVQPNSVSNREIPNELKPGTYLIECVLTGENIKPQIKKWKLHFNPNWSNSEKNMLNKNIKIEEYK